jgi:NADH:ubiquinone oxidoreductase subunit 4 (subunit M)
VLVLLGGFARHPVLGLWLAGALVALAAAHVRVARVALLEPPPDGDVVADANAREIAGLAPVVLLALLLGLWPAPLLSSVASGAEDASAATGQTERPATP